MDSEQPNIIEATIRAEIEDEVRQDYANLALAQEDRNRRVLALAISALIGVGIGLPALGLTLGLGVRLFYWASGL